MTAEADRAPDEREAITTGVIHVDLGDLSEERRDALLEDISQVVYGQYGDVDTLLHAHYDGDCATSPHCCGSAADRARAEVQAGVVTVCEEAEKVYGVYAVGKHFGAQVNTGEIRAALGDTAALDRMLAEARADERKKTLLGAADDMDEFRREVYGEHLFRRPTTEDYAAINALLQRVRGHGTDGIGADCYDRAIKVQAERLRDRAEGEGA
jgi:hypothetical protein